MLCLDLPIGMAVIARCSGTGGSEIAQAIGSLFATSSRDDNEDAAVQGVIKIHCLITDNTPITSHHGDVLHNIRPAVSDTRFVSSKGRTL